MKYIILAIALMLAGCASPSTTDTNSVTVSNWHIVKDGAPFYFTEHSDYFELPDEDYPRLGFNFTVTYTGEAPSDISDLDIQLENATKRTEGPVLFIVDGMYDEESFTPGRTAKVTVAWPQRHDPPYTVWFDDQKIAYTESPVNTTWTFTT